MGQEFARHQPDSIDSMHQPDVAVSSRSASSVPPDHTQRGIGHGTGKGMMRGDTILVWRGEGVMKYL